MFSISIDIPVISKLRSGPVEVDKDIAANLEEQLASDLTTNEDSDSEESDTVPYEWEAVSMNR